MEIWGVVGKWDVNVVKGIGQYLEDVCPGRGLFLANTFQNKVIHRYTWLRGNERRMIDYMTMNYRLKEDILSVKIV